MLAMVDMAYNDVISVTGALGMSVDEFESKNSNVEGVHELEMVCFSDGEHADDLTVINYCQSGDFNLDQSDKCDTDCELESGSSCEVQTRKATDSSIEDCSIGRHEEVVPVTQLFMNQHKPFQERIMSGNVDDDYVKTKVTSLNPRAFFCDVCKERFAEKLEFRHHMATHAVVKWHSCCYCSRTFQYQSQLVLHMKRHTDSAVSDVRFPCHICKREFRSSSGVRKHRRVHDDVQRHKCSVCFKTFPFASTLAEHERIHSAACPFICDFCGRGFKHTSNLLKHRRLMHRLSDMSSCQHCRSQKECACSVKEKSSSQSSASSNFQCPVCFKCFTNKFYKEIHLRVHSGERPYKCQICEFSFKQQSNLSKHMLTAHSSQRPFSCRFCSKTFAVNSNLKDHEKIHTNDRQFPCVLCSKRFITAAALGAHVARHDNRETSAVTQVFSDTSRCHTCGTCGKLFPSVVALRQHAAVHSTDRSFVCKTCGRCFKYASNLYAHRRLHQRKERDIVKLHTDWVTCEVQIPLLSNT